MITSELRTGMKVKCGNTIVEVTGIGTTYQDGECHFSGRVVSSTDDYYKNHVGKVFYDNWNSAFSYPV